MPLPLQFRLNPTDRAGFYDEPFFRTITVQDTNAALQGTYTVPDDRMLVLTSLAWDVAGAAPITVDAFAIYIADRSGNPQTYLFNQLPAVTRTFGDRQYSGLIIPRSALVRFLAAFSSGAGMNRVTGYLAGFLSAHGNFPAI